MFVSPVAGSAVLSSNSNSRSGSGSGVSTLADVMMTDETLAGPTVVPVRAALPPAGDLRYRRRRRRPAVSRGDVKQRRWLAGGLIP